MKTLGELKNLFGGDDSCKSVGVTFNLDENGNVLATSDEHTYIFEPTQGNIDGKKTNTIEFGNYSFPIAGDFHDSSVVIEAAKSLASHILYAEGVVDDSLAGAAGHPDIDYIIASQVETLH